MSKPKILIVEDEAFHAKMLEKALLKLKKYDVVSIVDNYNDALKKVKEYKPDALIIDINLNGSKSGIDLANKIHKTSDIPFIYLTADVSEEIIEQIKDNYPYIVKPVRKDDLEASLHKILYKDRRKNTLISLGNNYTYDALAENIYYHNALIKLSPKEKLLLSILVSGKNTIVPLSIIDNHVWEDPTSFAPNKIRSLRCSLRKKLKFLTIETETNVGSRLIVKN